MSSTTARPGTAQGETADYAPGLYVGCDRKLTGDQLRDLSLQHYWRWQSSVPEIPHRGYQLIQLFSSISASGIAVDLDVTQTDLKGSKAQWLRLAI
jgi:hypothetical protein